MKIDYPNQAQTEALRQLWKEAFDDKDSFMDTFFMHGFASDRCRCISDKDRVVAALYWFDCSVNGHPLAYLYGIATDKAYRNSGFCRSLLENTHNHLNDLGYAGTVLVPAEESLFHMYEKLGYQICSYMLDFTAIACKERLPLRPLNTEEYCKLRKEYLQLGSVIQEGDGIRFLQNIASFYEGEGCVFAVSKEEDFIPELLGNIQNAGRIVTALGKTSCQIRTPGYKKPFAMYHPLSDIAAPTYFGLAFD